MKWFENYYVSSKIKYNRTQIKKKIFRFPTNLSLHIISISNMKDSMVDIIPVIELKLYPKSVLDNLYIIGVVTSEDEAKQYILKLLQDVYSSQGEYQLKNYFLKRIGEFS